jgi:hypothetical protein
VDHQHPRRPRGPPRGHPPACLFACLPGPRRGRLQALAPRGRRRPLCRPLPLLHAPAAAGYYFNSCRSFWTMMAKPWASIRPSFDTSPSAAATGVNVDPRHFSLDFLSDDRRPPADRIQRPTLHTAYLSGCPGRLRAPDAALREDPSAAGLRPTELHLLAILPRRRRGRGGGGGRPHDQHVKLQGALRDVPWWRRARRRVHRRLRRRGLVVEREGDRPRRPEARSHAPYPGPRRGLVVLLLRQRDDDVDRPRRQHRRVLVVGPADHRGLGPPQLEVEVQLVRHRGPPRRSPHLLAAGRDGEGVREARRRPRWMGAGEERLSAVPRQVAHVPVGYGPGVHHRSTRVHTSAAVPLGRPRDYGGEGRCRGEMGHAVPVHPAMPTGFTRLLRYR